MLRCKRMRVRDYLLTFCVECGCVYDCMYRPYVVLDCPYISDLELQKATSDVIENITACPI